MLSRHKTLRSGVVALGAGALLVLSSSVPASAANEGDHWIRTANCTADQEIQVHFVNGGWHDEQELNPTVAPPGCEFVLTDHGKRISDTWGAGSGWWYDGPEHYICATVYDYGAQSAVSGVCN
ncbi:hypothetical protein BX285_4576 [Streptomyces sp. 1114.5]|uniref:hypothetical protein n=1 Tax=Streptomyces sp. 1114.5 TaxID=1938830 RepID=UPI000EB1A8E2|nr:hypothetical protein [Streptomyces sp. 1114.5]RKT20095.1 hypothetical protein BX285_4576 [Streptomyces sp. 1114.5]